MSSGTRGLREGFLIKIVQRRGRANKAMSISFCMNIFVALIIARSVRPAVHFISPRELCICLSVYIYIFSLFLSVGLPCPGSISSVPPRIEFTSFSGFALFLVSNAARWTCRRSGKDSSVLSHPCVKTSPCRAK